MSIITINDKNNNTTLQLYELGKSVHFVLQPSIDEEIWVKCLDELIIPVTSNKLLFDMWVKAYDNLLKLYKLNEKYRKNPFIVSDTSKYYGIHNLNGKDNIGLIYPCEVMTPNGNALFELCKHGDHDIGLYFTHDNFPVEQRLQLTFVLNGLQQNNNFEKERLQVIKQLLLDLNPSKEPIKTYQI